MYLRPPFLAHSHLQAASASLKKLKVFGEGQGAINQSWTCNNPRTYRATMTEESSDVPRELIESIKDVIGRKIKISVKKKVKLEVKGDKVENKVLVLTSCRAFLVTARIPTKVGVHEVLPSTLTLTQCRLTHAHSCIVTHAFLNMCAHIHTHILQHNTHTPHLHRLLI